MPQLGLSALTGLPEVGKVPKQLVDFGIEEPCVSQDRPNLIIPDVLLDTDPQRGVVGRSALAQDCAKLGLLVGRRLVAQAVERHQGRDEDVDGLRPPNVIHPRKRAFLFASHSGSYTRGAVSGTGRTLAEKVGPDSGAV